jgi:hypothetical protein
MKKIVSYLNGNSNIELYDDGTRIIQFENELKLDYPLNLDIRVSSACSLGYNPKTKKAVCEFCHESARTDGKECNYDLLKEVLNNLPAGIELAIGGNKLTPGLTDFLLWSKSKGFINNLTVNHLHINRDEFMLKMLLEKKIIRGLGISYRKDYPINFDQYFHKHPNVVLHVIAGIDNVDEVIATPFQKVLVLGYKTFGFGVEYQKEHDVKTSLQEWYYYVRKMMDVKNIVSFDNLALDQLNIKRFCSDKMWERFNQGEHSFYINAVDQYFAPSSRSNEKTSWYHFNVKDYFWQIENKGEERTKMLMV